MIVLLYQHEIAIPFFQSDKLGVYNSALNLYSHNQIYNSKKITDLYETIVCMNNIGDDQNGKTNMGNETLFEDNKIL